MDRNLAPFCLDRTAQGQARKSLWIETLFPSARVPTLKGQARKSLWIETVIGSFHERAFGVRLVRACGSKLHQIRCQGHKFLVRLVRACGSKPGQTGQGYNCYTGQARKSLWIETRYILSIFRICPVRLVRACGSKHYYRICPAII